MAGVADYPVIGIPYRGEVGADGTVEIPQLEWTFPVPVRIERIAIRNDCRSFAGEPSISLELNQKKIRPAPLNRDSDTDIEFGEYGISSDSFILAIVMTGLAPGRTVSGIASIFFQMAPPPPAERPPPEPTVIAVPYDWSADDGGLFTLAGREWAAPVAVRIQSITVKNRTPCGDAEHQISVRLQRDFEDEPGSGPEPAEHPPYSDTGSFRGCDPVEFSLAGISFTGTKFRLDLRMTGFQGGQRVAGAADVYFLQTEEGGPRKRRATSRGRSKE